MNILWLWPDILNLHGDRGNVMALARICALYGTEADIVRVNRLGDDFDIGGADMAVLGSGELAALPGVTAALSKRLAELKAWTESGGVLLATGTTGAALGTSTARTDGSRLQGLGLLDMECCERKTVLGDDLIFRAGGHTVYGIQIQMMDISLAAGQAPFGETVYGRGNDGKGGEGATKNGIIFTNALGPLLVKNPWLTIDLINRSLARGAPPHPPLRFDPALFETELASAKAIEKFNETKKRPRK